MAFVVPNFNLVCNVFRFVARPGPLSVIASSPDCNLQFSRKVNIGLLFPYNGPEVNGEMFLLLPIGTDIRDNACYSDSTIESDLVEVPAGSGRYYYVASVDDVGKGFPNEFRCAVIVKTPYYGLWPSPIP